MDFIRNIFGDLLNWLYQFAGDYGLALILFSLIVKFVLLPMNAKSKKSMLKMSRIAPLAKALEAKYGEDKAKYQQELMQLYKKEGVSATGGCLWSLLPLLILLPLYRVVQNPLVYIMDIPADLSEKVIATLAEITGNAEITPLAASKIVYEHKEALVAAVEGLNPDLLTPINFNFLGIDLAQRPTYAIWNNPTWSVIGGALLALISGGSNMLSMWVSQKLNGSVATNAKGEKDTEAAKKGSSMTFIMPIMSVIFGFMLPAAITVYWIAQALIGLVIDSLLTIHYRKVYAAEDALRREEAAELAAIEAEKERIRAERRAANPDGITENTSKKKQERKEREEREAATKRYELEKAGIDPDAPKEVDPSKCPSGIAERPNCRGRAYDPNRYKN